MIARRMLARGVGMPGQRCWRLLSDSHEDFQPKKKTVPTGMEEVLQLIDRQVKENDVMLYMKGTPSAPQCGFSLNAVRILNAVGVDFSSVNVLESRGQNV